MKHISAYTKGYIKGLASIKGGLGARELLSDLGKVRGALDKHYSEMQRKLTPEYVMSKELKKDLYDATTMVRDSFTLTQNLQKPAQEREWAAYSEWENQTQNAQRYYIIEMGRWLDNTIEYLQNAASRSQEHLERAFEAYVVNPSSLTKSHPKDVIVNMMRSVQKYDNFIQKIKY